MVDGNHGYPQANDFDSSHTWSHSVEKQSKNSQKQSYIFITNPAWLYILSHCVESLCRHCIIRWKSRRWWRGNTVILRGVCKREKKPEKTHIQRVFCRIISQSPTARFPPLLSSLSLSLSFLLLLYFFFFSLFTFPREALSLSAVVWSSTLRFFPPNSILRSS